MRISVWSSDVCSSDLKAAHVRAAIESALAQSFPAHEILVIDNGSTDGGRELAAAIGDERIKLLDLAAPGPGGYAGRNIGIRAAGGDWIATLDADRSEERRSGNEWGRTGRSRWW